VNSERHEQIARVFEAVRAAAPLERAGRIEELCAGDLELRREIESLASFLEAPDEGIFATRPADPARPPLLDLVTTAQQPPLSRIGHYTLLGVLGEGGMGIVYRARQENPARIVALKLMKPFAVSEKGLRRFENEAQILGKLQHPGIARVFEAGTAQTPLGPQPFFAMELVDGSPLLHHAREHKLDTRGRLEIFVKVCAAIQYAHDQGVVHRDLKPGNILVDKTGQPRILDFGVARVTDADLQLTSVSTEMGQLLGTLPYMSPEQLACDPAAIDSRSDVYSLGVVLYELLTELLPHDLDGRSIPEAVRVIHEEDAVSVASVDRRYRGDLDTIVAKALEKDRVRRYSTAAELAADLERFLRDEPILARPPSTMYQLAKFSKRNQVLVGSVVLLFVILVATVATVTVLLFRATTERSKQLALNDFLVSMFGSADPWIGKSREVTVVEILEDAVRKLDTLAGQPEVEASARLAIGNIYRSLGRHDDAIVHLKEAHRLRLRELGRWNVETGEAAMRLAYAIDSYGSPMEAEPLFREALAIQRRLRGTSDPEIVRTLTLLGSLRSLLGDDAEAEALLREALAIATKLEAELERLNQPRLQQVEVASYRLAGVLASRGDLEAAAPLAEKALEGYRSELGSDHPQVALVMVNLARVLRMRGDLDKAQALLEEALLVYRRKLKEHPRIADALQESALVARALGRNADARRLFEQAQSMNRQMRGGEHLETANSLGHLAAIAQESGDLDSAESMLGEALAIRRLRLPVDHLLTATTARELGSILLDLGRKEEAKALLKESLPALRRYSPGQASEVESLLSQIPP